MAYGYAPPPPPRKSGSGLMVGLLIGGFVIVAGGVAVVLLLWFLGVFGGQDQNTAHDSRNTPNGGQDAANAEPDPDSDTAGIGGSAEVPSELDGIWSGEMSQYDPDGIWFDDFDLNLHLTEGSRIASGFLYASDGTRMCDWVADIEDAGPDHVYGPYEVTDDPDGTCVSEGEMWVDASNGSVEVVLEVDWTGEGISRSEGDLYVS
ncbi:hypothetical protein RIF23_14250 [Lipingzhangella sp. LS1_29]|uniref:Uncharacterized protein n=1 Tax=Lipingzhangella rawalii TaxID=2055835 RepID=A0ABU2H816_9ACTN|nr:hypothetical protein [Lipingzhangella rawalii]MDS1271456.1 hypothetical protein [Lipingzhangella rawalii]